MKTLIAVISYQGDAENGAHQAIRDTWGKDVIIEGADLRFFVGRRNSEFQPKFDEVLVEWQKTRPCKHEWYASVDGCCEDFWQFEAREILRWSIQQGYDFTFLCCNDTFIIPRKLMASDFQKYDYSGYFIPRDNPWPLGTKTTEKVYGHNLYLWADAGVGWFMSRKAAELVIVHEPNHWPVDIFVGQVLGPLIAKGEILAENIQDFWNNISWHYRWVTGTAYNPKSNWMKTMYEYHENAYRQNWRPGEQDGL